MNTGGAGAGRNRGESVKNPRRARRPNVVRNALQSAAISARRANPTTHRAGLALARRAADLAQAATDAETDFVALLRDKMEHGGGGADGGSSGGDGAAGEAAGEGRSVRDEAHAGIGVVGHVRSAEEWARMHARDPRTFLQAAETASLDLWPHQRQLAALVARNEAEPFEGVRGGVLNEPVGNGKTRTVLHVVLEAARRRVREGRSRFGFPTLVVVPKSLQLQWEDEIRKYYGPHLIAFKRVADSVEANARDSALDLDVAHVMYCLDLVITSYDTLKSAVRAMAEKRGIFAVPWERLVLDEGTTIVNKSTAVFQACDLLDARCRLLISATPLPNSRTRELNSILAFLRCYHRIPDDAATADGAEESRAIADLRTRLVTRYLLRVTSENASGTVLETSIIWTDLEDTAERECYAAILRRMHEDPSHYIRWITKLREACISPVLLLPEAERRALPADRPPSTKIRHLLEYLRQRVGPQEKALVFCEWVQSLREVAHHLERAEISHAMVTGAMSVRERSDIFRAACAEDSPEPRVLLLPNKLGERGLNLQRFNHVLQLTGHWGPGTDIQLNGRINRPGQTRPMHSFKFVTRGTIEVAVLRVNQEKDERQHRMLARDATLLSATTEEETQWLQQALRAMDAEKRARHGPAGHAKKRVLDQL